MTLVVMAQRLADILQRFPAAAMGGVQWSTLVRKYELQHNEKIDLDALGHTSALGAATALLWDVVRVVDSSDIDNPVVAIEDEIALTPLPGSLASWPSLYKTLCDIVCKHGFPERNDDQGSGVKSHAILLSQVKPLLKEHWHANFDDSGLCYFTEEGTVSKLKKMKHLMDQLPRWRTQRIAWRASVSEKALAVDDSQMFAARTMRNSVDAAVEMRLECVPSKSHNDLLLRCICCDAATEESLVNPAKPVAETCDKPKLDLDLVGQAEAAPSSGTQPNSPTSQSYDQLSSVSANSALQDEIERLRSENAQLRSENRLLHDGGSFVNHAKPQLELFNLPLEREPELADVFDNPFEPPPELRSYKAAWAASPAASTCVGSNFSFGSGFATPLTDSRIASGYATPVPAKVEQVGSAVGQLCSGVTLVPVWFSMSDRFEIPSGVVQQARAVFERHASIPSFFTQQTS